MKKLFTTTLLLCFSILFAFAQHHNTNQAKAFFGMHSYPLSKEKVKKLKLDQPYGNYVTHIIKNTAAEKNNFQAFDYIYKIGEYQFDSHQSLANMMYNFKPGDEAMVYFIRNGKELSQKVKFGREEDARYETRGPEADPFLGIEQNHSKIPEGVNGVSVSIVAHSTAEKMNLQYKDVITEINGYPIFDWHDTGAAIDMMEVGEEIDVKYYRNGQYNEATAPIKSYAKSKNIGHHDEKEIATQTVEKTPMPAMDISMNDMPEEDAAKMKEELNIDMPTVQNLEIEQLNIFPNPSQGLFNLKFNLPNNAPTIVRIFNGSGQLIYNNELGNFSGAFSGPLDLSNNPTGTYYLMIQQGRLSISKKILIIRS